MSKRKTILVKPNQTIWDVALQEHGSIEGVFDILSKNPDLTGLNDELDTAEEIDVDSNLVIDRRFKDYSEEDEDLIGTRVGQAIEEPTPIRIGLHGAPMKTNASPSFAANDDADFQRGAGIDAWTLAWENPLYGGKTRFRGITGGYQESDYLGNGGDYYTKNDLLTDRNTAIPENIVIDWSTYNELDETVTGFLIVVHATGNAPIGLDPDENPLDTITESIDNWCNNSPYTTNGYPDWYVITLKEFVHIMNQSLQYRTGHAPFNFLNNNGSRQILISDLRYNIVTTQIWYAVNGTLNPFGTRATIKGQTILRREFTITELKALL